MENETKNYSPIVWGVAGGLLIGLLFYLLQALGMQSWQGPLYQFRYRWYFILPLILGFAVQAGLFRAIHLKTRHGGGGVLTASGGVSTTAMIGCCLHNLVFLLPILGLSGAVVFFGAYQSYIFLTSIAFVLGGVIYMGWKYQKIKRLSCHRPTGVK